MSQKSYNGNSTMFLVPTPIGNLEDITYRAIKVLNEVDVVFSEDTRVTLNLLNHYNIKKKLISAHKFNEEKIVSTMLEFLSNGKDIALVSDRGTPLISDPGNICVKKVISSGYNVVSLPGSTALIPALTVSGLDTDRFLFYGFLNSKSSKRQKELENLKKEKFTLIFYEAPHRLLETLEDILNIFGNRQVSISREISKKYEEIYRGTLKDVIKEIEMPKGEFVIVIEGNTEIETYENISIIEHYNMYIKEGYNEKDAIKQVAKDRNLKKDEVYKKIKLFPGK